MTTPIKTLASSDAAFALTSDILPVEEAVLEPPTKRSCTEVSSAEIVPRAEIMHPDPVLDSIFRHWSILHPKAYPFMITSKKCIKTALLCLHRRFGNLTFLLTNMVVGFLLEPDPNSQIELRFGKVYHIDRKYDHLHRVKALLLTGTNIVTDTAIPNFRGRCEILSNIPDRHYPAAGMNRQWAVDSALLLERRSFVTDGTVTLPRYTTLYNEEDLHAMVAVLMHGDAEFASAEILRAVLDSIPPDCFDYAVMVHAMVHGNSTVFEAISSVYKDQFSLRYFLLYGLAVNSNVTGDPISLPAYLLDEDFLTRAIYTIQNIRNKAIEVEKEHYEIIGFKIADLCRSEERSPAFLEKLFVQLLRLTNHVDPSLFPSFFFNDLEFISNIVMKVLHMNDELCYLTELVLSAYDTDVSWQARFLLIKEMVFCSEVRAQPLHSTSLDTSHRFFRRAWRTLFNNGAPYMALCRFVRMIEPALTGPNFRNKVQQQLIARFRAEAPPGITLVMSETVFFCNVTTRS
jgi:hypothetical protein